MDIKGDTSAATQGAAALRAEGAAARDTVAALATMGRGSAALATVSRGAAAAASAVAGLASGAKGAGLEVATRGADALANAWTRLRGASVADALAKEQAKLSRLQGAQGAIGKGGSSDVGAGRALQAEIDKSSQKVGTLSTRLARAGIAGKDFKVSAVPAIKAAGEASAGAASNVLRYGAALAGISSLGALAQMAAGWRGMAALQMLSFRATQDVRRLMTGVDSSPLVRGVSMLEKNLSLSTVTGSALSGILQRGFGALFGLVERGAPLISAVFEGMVIGALRAEIALLRARAALAPLTVAIEDWAGSEDAMGKAAKAGEAGLYALGAAAAYSAATLPIALAKVAASTVLSGARLGALGISATGAAAPFIALAAAVASVGVALDQGIKLYREWDSAAIRKSWAGVGEAGERAQQGSAYRSDADLRLSDADYAKKFGGGDKGGATSTIPTGKALADGIVTGMASGEAGVAAGAAKLVRTANEAARTAAQAHSPSELFRRGVGKDIPDGVAAGFDDNASTVQAAADRSLVPSQPKASSSGGAQGTSASSVTFQHEAHYHFHGDAPKREDVEAADRSGFRAGLRQLCFTLGVPVPGT